MSNICLLKCYTQTRESIFFEPFFYDMVARMLLSNAVYITCIRISTKSSGSLASIWKTLRGMASPKILSSHFNAFTRMQATKQQ